MDRFSSREEPRPWDSTAWRDGHCARMANSPQTPPAKLTGWQKKSWLAGWADADMALAAETMSSRIAEWKMTSEEFIAHRLKKRAL